MVVQFQEKKIDSKVMKIIKFATIHYSNLMVFKPQNLKFSNEYLSYIFSIKRIRKLENNEKP